MVISLVPSDNIIPDALQLTVPVAVPDGPPRKLDHA